MAKMQIGLMLSDSSQKSLAEKVREAAQCHREKYGTEPDLCYANFKGEENTTVDDIQVFTDEPHVPPSHLWIGRSDA